MSSLLEFCFPKRFEVMCLAGCSVVSSHRSPWADGHVGWSPGLPPRTCRSVPTLCAALVSFLLNHCLLCGSASYLISLSVFELHFKRSNLVSVFKVCWSWRCWGAGLRPRLCWTSACLGSFRSWRWPRRWLPLALSVSHGKLVCPPK